MNERIALLRDRILDKEHHQYRQDVDDTFFEAFTKTLDGSQLNDVERATQRLINVFQMEKPVILERERIAFMRTVKTIPEIWTASEWEEKKEHHYIHEMGKVCNLSPDYGSTIKVGLLQRKQEAEQRMEAVEDEEQKVFLQSVIDSIESVFELVERYADEARRVGNTEVAAILERVPRYGATTFHEALQFFRILHYTLWCSYNYHNTVGRFDQYMYPYLKADLDSGRLDETEAFDLLEEFFLSFNKDSDLYPGMQQGDNGQSMVLGGVDKEGKDATNLLTTMCLKASLELKLIDPKINLRVNNQTSLETYVLGTELTKQGLGFPQYNNDDIIIPGLLDKGYSLEDARDYVVAACWEPIIPGVGMDIPNIGALSFGHVVGAVVNAHLKSCETFEELMAHVVQKIQTEVDREIDRFKNLYMEPTPFMSILMDGCIQRAKDVSHGLRYNNFGLHGTGIANATDSLAAIKKYVYEEKSLHAKDLIQALKEDFSNDSTLLTKLKCEAPKMGNDNDDADKIAVELLHAFADTLQGKTNERGGCYRAGTGSAMFYVWHGRDLGASADGRRKGEYLSANYAPSLDIKTKGVLSIIQSFVKPELKEVINGGPLTIELHDTVFRHDESMGKVAMLVKAFVDAGGHQLQINTLNRETLLEAQKHPEKHKNLIVRVWGWSGYFVELDKEYQDHIIQRVELRC